MTVDKIAAVVDSKLDMLVHIKNINQAFFNEFTREFLTDRLTFIGFEQDLVRALQAVANIVVYREEHDLGTVWVKHKLRNGTYSDEPFDSYEGAFRFAVGLLHIK